MNQKHWSIIDLDNQAKHHEEVAHALRLVMQHIRIPDETPLKRVASAKARKAMSRGMRAYWRKRKANKS